MQYSPSIYTISDIDNEFLSEPGECCISAWRLKHFHSQNDLINFLWKLCSLNWSSMILKGITVQLIKVTTNLWNKLIQIVTMQISWNNSQWKWIHLLTLLLTRSVFKSIVYHMIYRQTGFHDLQCWINNTLSELEGIF
jgi:hypothetical protein